MTEATQHLPSGSSGETNNSSPFPSLKVPSGCSKAEMEEWIASAGVHSTFKSLFEELLLSRPDNIPDAVIRYMVNKYPDQTSDWISGQSSDVVESIPRGTLAEGPVFSEH